MITSIDAFLRYFDGVHRRTMRDIGTLPPEADGWHPPTDDDHDWDVNAIVGHIAATRRFFIDAYLGEGWSAPTPPDTSSRDLWLPAIDRSFTTTCELLSRTPDEWLSRRVTLADAPEEIAGWRVLLMMVEHEVHHRSQLMTWAGMNGWPVPDLFGRRWEQIEGLSTRG